MDINARFPAYYTLWHCSISPRNKLAGIWSLKRMPIFINPKYFMDVYCSTSQRPHSHTCIVPTPSINDSPSCRSADTKSIYNTKFKTVAAIERRIVFVLLVHNIFERAYGIVLGSFRVSQTPPSSSGPSTPSATSHQPTSGRRIENTPK